jgi:hypothetical protein
MRKVLMARAGALLMLTAAAGCEKPVRQGAGATVPTRKAGLWEQVLTRDGKPGRLGGLKLCLDAATGARFSVFGHDFDRDGCRRSVTRDAAGAYHFASTCPLEAGGVASLEGTATGDFNSDYDIHAHMDVSGAPFGPMNGAHAIHVTGRYKGPCPSDMSPGEASLGAGLKVNIDRLPQVARAMAGG